MVELRFRSRQPFGSARPNQQFDSAMPDHQDDTGSRAVVPEEPEFKLINVTARSHDNSDPRRSSRDPMVKKINDEKQKVDTRANYLKLVSS